MSSKMKIIVKKRVNKVVFYLYYPKYSEKRGKKIILFKLG